MTPDEFASELDRVEALLKWWGAPGFGYDGFTQTHLKRFEAIMAELEKAAGEISARQEETLTQSKDLLMQSLPVFVGSHNLNEVLAAQSKILVSLLEAASAQAKTWVSFSDKIRHHVDQLEVLVDDNYWPLPKYRALLLNTQVFS